MATRLLVIVFTSTLLGACATEPGITLPTRDAVRERLEAAKRTDPNRQLCEQITEHFVRGDRDALRPNFDHGRFVERIIARGSLSSEIQDALRARASTFEDFARLNFPDGSSFLCLGTRSLLNEPHIAIRQWTARRFDYVLLHLSGNAQLPIDDYMTVSGGSYHSEANALSFSPDLRPYMAIVNRWIQLSYEDRFAEIIADYRTLPPSLQSSPVAFERFLNAVSSQERTDSPLYREAFAQMERIMADRPYSLAYWRFNDGRARGNASSREAGRRKLLELLDDYELLGK